MNNEELDLYIENAMKTGPDFHLPVDFAQKATLKITHSTQWKNDLLEYLYLSGLIFALISVGAGLYFYIDNILVLRILSIISQNSMQFILGFLLLNFILFADKVLLPLLFSRWKRV
jgi:hypothetical protein